MPADDAAVPAYAVLDVDALGAPRRAVEHLLLAIEHVPDRATGQHGAESRERLGQRVDLSAEAAPHGAADEMQPVGFEVQDLGRGAEQGRTGPARMNAR